MTRLRLLLVLLTLTAPAVAGCSASPSATPDGAGQTATEDELRSVATSFFGREPLSDAALEELRREVRSADDGYAWARNQGSSFALQWETERTEALTDAERVTLAQAGFTFHLRLGDPGARNRRYLSKVEVVVTSEAALEAAVDHVGLSAASGDADTLAVRARIVGALRTATRGRSVTVLKAELHYQVDMYWENALVVIDEQNRQMLVVTGGYGT